MMGSEGSDYEYSEEEEGEREGEVFTVVAGGVHGEEKREKKEKIMKMEIVKTRIDSNSGASELRRFGDELYKWTWFQL